MSASFELLLFSTHAAAITTAVAAGVHGIIVDWEWIGKQARQAGADTQINHDTLDDLRRVRSATTARVITRINRHHLGTRDEIESAIDAGADEILLPMVRTAAEVEHALGVVRERIGVGILIETVAATHIAIELSHLPLCRTYVGLNDLAIDRQSPNIFTALADQTVERVREACHGRFGFGGLTVPDGGRPIPCRLLIGEMARLDCHFSFLRRSFHRDLEGCAVHVAIPRLLQAIVQARLRSPLRVMQDRNELVQAIRAWHPTPTAEEVSSHAQSLGYAHPGHRAGWLHRR